MGLAQRRFASKLVLLGQAPLPVRFQVVTRGKVLYRASADSSRMTLFEADYRERAVKEYIDFKPLRADSVPPPIFNPLLVW